MIMKHEVEVLSLIDMMKLNGPKWTETKERKTVSIKYENEFTQSKGVLIYHWEYMIVHRRIYYAYVKC